jgi:sulfatase modifying factor 1
LRGRAHLGAIAGGAAVLVLVGVVIALHDAGTPPRRCAADFVTEATRCCPPGQREQEGRCVGPLSSCPEGFVVDHQGAPGCVVIAVRVPIAGGAFELGPTDWEGGPGPSRERVVVAPFSLDSHEVTHAAWRACVERGGCRALGDAEPGVPVTGVSPAEAAAYCRRAGGHLPRWDQWIFAAAGVAGRRYAWGATGLVCRRAVFGMVAGPCATGARGPELAGVRPAGATPDGVQDLAGNVAEWTVERDGSWAARGGSFAARFAAELKTWASVPGREPDVHVGFRCAYDAP